MKRYIFDTVTWLNILHDGRTTVDDSFRSRLLGVARKGRIEVLLTPAVLLELLNEKDYNRVRFASFWDFVRNVVSDRILLSTHQRIEMEATEKRSLNYEECVEQIDELVNDDNEIASLIRDVRAYKGKSRANDSRDTKALMDDCLSRSKSKAKLKSLLDQWKTQLIPSVDEWYDADSQRRSLRQRGIMMRTLYSYVLFEWARLHMLADPDLHDGRRGKICETRLFDQEIYTDGRATYCDYLVTEDKILLHIASAIRTSLPDSPEPIRFDDFVRHICKLSVAPKGNFRRVT